MDERSSSGARSVPVPAHARIASFKAARLRLRNQTSIANRATSVAGCSSLRASSRSHPCSSPGKRTWKSRMLVVFMAFLLPPLCTTNRGGQAITKRGVLLRRVYAWSHCGIAANQAVSGECADIGRREKVVTRQCGRPEAYSVPLYSDPASPSRSVKPIPVRATRACSEKRPVMNTLRVAALATTGSSATRVNSSLSTSPQYP